MDHTSQTILVAGATGIQGGAVLRRLLQDGWPVRALTRDPASPKAQQLTAMGVEVVAGDFDDRASLDRALANVYGVFSVQNFGLPGVGPAGEVRQGQALATAAQAAGVQHFIYSSVGGAERRSGIPHFESKWQIEQHVRALNLPHTILRPVAFMDNYAWMRPQLTNGVFPAFGLDSATKLQLIASDDIGAFAAIAFADPTTYLGQALELAGDERTEPAIAELFAQVIGRPVALGRMAGGPWANDPEQQRELAHMTNWFNTAGYQADIAALRRIHPGLMTLETWLRRNGWEHAEPMPLTPQAWG